MVYRFLKDESGVTAIEYSLIAAMVSVVAMAAFQAFGLEMRAMYDEVAQVVSDTIP
ncbi:Flp family type IVb pilin [Denitrobaculum tricleocarpae]|uniref:Flp family type IVb pilin n=1 Tax=Denitrobaculum tricleocarpae TaxID=2591009 RepID=A0A545TQD7_9PROT|nr:Flp family type IVb pilin [Denitrobaculum tricleocarpae]TQV79331.1 Flp family type IVb pilin [Denitrobaculum tricleocarpae]